MFSPSIITTAFLIPPTAKNALSRCCRGRPLTQGVSIHGFLLLCVNADLLAVAAKALEAYLAGHEGEQGVVGALAYARARVDLCAPLSYQDISGEYMLAVGAFYAKAFGLAVAAIPG